MKVYVLNTDAAAERFERFTTDYPAGFPAFTRRRAKTPEEVTAPKWFKYPAAYYANTVNFIEMFDECAAGTDPFLIFEDDCLFRPDFVEKFEDFMAEVPADWEYINFGPGHLQQNLYPPVQISENVLRPRYTFATHAIYVTPAGAKKCSDQLKKEPWGCVHIPDHQLGLLFLDPEFKVYAPLVTLCGQRAGLSSLTKREEPEKWLMGFKYRALDGKVKVSEDPYFSEG